MLYFDAAMIWHLPGEQIAHGPLKRLRFYQKKPLMDASIGSVREHVKKTLIFSGCVRYRLEPPPPSVSGRSNFMNPGTCFLAASLARRTTVANIIPRKM